MHEADTFRAEPHETGPHAGGHVGSYGVAAGFPQSMLAPGRRHPSSEARGGVSLSLWGWLAGIARTLIKERVRDTKGHVLGVPDPQG